MKRIAELCQIFLLVTSPIVLSSCVSSFVMVDMMVDYFTNINGDVYGHMIAAYSRDYRNGEYPNVDLYVFLESISGYHLAAWKVYENTLEWDLLISNACFSFEHEIQFLAYNAKKDSFIDFEEFYSLGLIDIDRFDFNFQKMPEYIGATYK